MAVGTKLTLIVNPGSSSRKYAVFRGEEHLASVVVEQMGHALQCTVRTNPVVHHPELQFTELARSTEHLLGILQNTGVIADSDAIEDVVMRIVAPTGYFLKHRILDDEALEHLTSLTQKAPLHITVELQELHVLRQVLPNARIVGISDSAFHANKPERAWNYGIALEDADRFEIKRFGYHGISASAVVQALHARGKVPRRLIICHLGSGASVTAINNGKSIDTTMGYSPLEGLIMATRSGSIDAGAYAALKHELHLNDQHMQQYLNKHGGLLGLSGVSEGVKEVLEHDSHAARLAIETYVYAVQKAIGHMTAALQGVDMIVFTGTVGERAALIRERTMQAFHYLDFYIDNAVNAAATNPRELTCVSKLGQSKPIFIVPANEDLEMFRLSRSVIE